MKRARLFFAAILVPIDYLMLLLAAFFTYFIRFESLRTIRPVIYEIPSGDYVDVVTLVAASWIVLFALNGLYTMTRMRVMDELGRVLFGCATGFVAVVIYLVFTQELFSSRFILLGAFIAAIVSVTIGRLVIRGLERLTLARGIGVTNLVLIGAPTTRVGLRNGFTEKPSMGYRVVAEHNHLTPETTEAVKALRAKGRVDGIMLTDPKVPHEEALEATNLAEDLHVRFFYSADLFAAASSNMVVHTLAGLPLIEVKKTRLDGWGRIWKRLFDIIGSLILLVITLPFTLPAALAVLIETRRPIFFKNERIGEHGRPFDTLKFRSMHQKYSIGKQFGGGEEALAYEQKLIEETGAKKGPVYKIKDDPRVTRVGRFLRRWSIDELPQLWNVLMGDMSLVGPRPHQPREVAAYARHHHHVLEIKPGITGLAQISGRSDLDFEDEVRLDTYYIENWSLKLDLFILAKTPFVVLLRRGAY